MKNNVSKTIIGLLLSLSFGRGWGGASYAQVNIVPNASFEYILPPCSTGAGGVNLGYVPPWDSPSDNSPDLFNACNGSGTTGGAPLNGRGHQYPKTGNGYTGCFFYLLPEEREYIQAPLDSTLIAGHKYCVSFYVNTSSFYGIAINNIGLYFSQTHVYNSTFTALNLIPQVNETSIISDTLNWTEISGNYIAAGGEKYIIIGNFYTDTQTDTMTFSAPVMNWGSYYFIDDVSLVDCTYDGVNEKEKDENISIYPNPSNGKFQITSSKYKVESVRVMDVMGRIVNSEQLIVNSEITIDMSGFAKGIYFVRVTDVNKNVVNRKIVLQ